MFKVGDIVIGKPGAPYIHTGAGVLCRILHIKHTPSGDLLLVERAAGDREFEWSVAAEHFAYPDSNENAVTLLNKEE